MEAPTTGVEAVLGAVAFATERFLRDEAWHDRIDEVLARLGTASSVSRAYLFQNVRGPEGRLWMDLRFEWNAEGVSRIFDLPANHLHPYAPDFTRWIEVLGERGVVAGSVADLPDTEREVLAGEGVRMILAVPVFVGSEWWGFAGFDQTREEREWTATEVDALRAVAGALGASIERQLAVETLRFTEHQYRSIVEHIPAVTYIDGLSATAPTVYISPQVESMLGYAQQEWIADAELWPKILHPDDRSRALAEHARHVETGEPFSLEYRMFAKDGRVVWVLDRAELFRDDQGVPRYSHGVVEDISDRKRADEHVAFLAYHDELTGLPSRSMFEELLELSIDRARRHDGSVAVVCVDLDDFRLVNDSLGHSVGDELLKLVAERLREATRETDLVARRGGDQFLLLLGDLERERGDVDAATIRAGSVVQRIHDAFGSPFDLDGTELYVSASMGISLFPADGDEPGGLLRNAEAAMYESKKSGPAGYVVSARGSVDSAAKLRFVTRLRKAVETQRWVMHYQPVIALATGTMEGVEALVRWREPDGTMIPPGEFIPLAEELGLIEAIGEWVVNEIVFQARAWLDLGIDLEIGFNLSPRQFWQPDLAERILARIVGGGVEPSRILVEVTESSAMMDPDRAQEILWNLNRAGLRIAIDDFGTGYSSLSRLREVPVEILKIDRSFVSGVDRDPAAASIVAAFIELARGLGMVTLAEGIETQGELDLLVERGCQMGQGFLFSRPVPPEEIIALALAGLPVATRSA